MKKIGSVVTAAALAGMLVLTGCGKQDANSSANGKSETSDLKTQESPKSGPITINPKIEDKEILGKGPYGEKAVSAKTLKLTEAEIAKIKKGNYKAAIVMHYTGNDYSTAQIRALKATFKRMGVKVIAVTDAQFKAEKQVSDIETVLAKKPDIIVSVPVDRVSTAGAFKKAADAGVKVVFVDGVANDLKPGKDYVSVVSGDNSGNGAAAAEVMGEKLGGKGKIGVIYHDADFFVTKQRSDEFEKTIKEKYPKIKIVARAGISGPNDGEKVASGMLTKYRDLDGLFVIWDVPAEGALAAARTAGKDNLVVTTTDLGTNVGLEIASGGIVKGLGAQLPYDQGVTEAMLAGYAMIGKKAPTYVAAPAVKVTKDNVLESWRLVYGADAPDVIKDAAK
ncbi:MULTISPECIES: substrate-binding domain-containing protein [Fictibacillus]|uniref:Sugar ABC transporter substrate-binding protein n=1 Tax=Fictibacillus enclensis TaxID=1017270 RepID=A0A0V8J4V3_9BACL|nr:MULTISPECIES: substrate-binding domain-containing protein [Fictibacillus]KSU82142.1 sugar ABC transporter substrate-binding protein [Fictibacillus enclensis]RXZ01568.1 sugar ABC transporter substrate-binding protein [Fictibacillus sp. S7]SCC30904.1 ribose transport system substrate-binding protein [Fictibacillus enclensis]